MILNDPVMDESRQLAPPPHHPLCCCFLEDLSDGEGTLGGSPSHWILVATA